VSPRFGCCLECVMAQPEFQCSVTVRHVPEHSDPHQGVTAWAYAIVVRNTGDITAQLVARHWVITDANGQVQEVRGLAVVGHQPVLAPGESFDYTSWVQLGTPSGTMRGTFFCMTEDARPFEAVVPEFALNLASALH